MNKTILQTSSSIVAISIAGLAHAAGGPIEPIMQTLPGGNFTMGSDQPVQNGPKGEVRQLKSIGPAHQVTVKAFRIGKYEVTAHEFRRFAESSGYQAPKVCNQMASKEWFDELPGNWAGNKHTSGEFEPVTCLGWSGAQAYVAWLAQQTGKKYRLPTEAEWEYAARAGSNTPYYWGDDIGRTQSCAYANVADQSAEAAIKRDYDGLESKNHIGVVPCDDGAGYASVVGMYKPNAFGLYDMIGNINEYTADCQNPTHEGAPTDGRARLDGDCSKRVLKGGSWHWPLFTSAQRGSRGPDLIGALEGFRVVEELSDEAQAKAGQQLSPATAAFERALADAQKQALAKRKP
ncbi:formylglycine-generating enzyme family protein [Roseateles oligotrophus]|uniref:Formylglycine-generating enzyme family protein n=1 Tax=Roseateles oligotrophus TaxID=1769250 RepID=A0ABT2YD38_9BURK|nr:formylglycine-generating enzyme family protein [Roseateles oligotrophus]MCV2367952.1 formylglycine-generating enzyme family protein [Roseateles oligotrophus]